VIINALAKIVATLAQIVLLALVWAISDRAVLPTINALMVLAMGAFVFNQTVSHAMDIHSIVLLECVAQQISTTRHVLEFLVVEAVNSQANVPEIKPAYTENVAQLY
jgi:hypothetical protein